MAPEDANSAWWNRLLLSFCHLFSPFRCWSMLMHLASTKLLLDVPTPLWIAKWNCRVVWQIVEWSQQQLARRFSYSSARQASVVVRTTAAPHRNIVRLSCLLLMGLHSSSIEATPYGLEMGSSDQLESKFFLVKPSDVYVIEGESTELKCQISADSGAGPVQWAKDGFLLGYEPIIPGYDRYIMSVNETTRTYNLHIVNARLEDEAEFECQTSGSSGGGSTSSSKHPIRASAHLNLIVAPKSVFINSTRLHDNPPSVISLGSPLFNASTTESHFMSAASAFGHNNESSTFQSHSSTFIIEAYEAEKIVIVCSVSLSKPPPRLKWYRKNTELLPEASKTTVSKTLLSNKHTLYAVESSLVLYPKSDEDYRCQVEHPGLSKPLRATAQINIFRKPNTPVIEGYNTGKVINYKQKLNLKCISNNGYPPPSVVWLRNGVEIDRSYNQVSRHEVVNTLTWVVQQQDNQAQFTCQVMNALTPVPLQQSVTLNVHLSPTHVKITAPKEVRLNEPQGSSVTLECSAYPASPLPNNSKIRWLIDNNPVNLDEAIHVVKHDQQSWTIRSNLTFVVNSKQPLVRNIVCTAFSTTENSEVVSATHQISVIYPPELPTLFGVKNGVVTVHTGEIFKCKCVCYSGNPRANLVWLNHQNREISALTTNTSSGVSSELVIRPTARDHGSVFRCHVLHPALEKPYEVSFTLHVLFGPEHLNITFPKFIKENDTIKIECTTSPSNPCPTIMLLKDGKKMDGDHNAMIRQIADRSSNLMSPWLTEQQTVLTTNQFTQESSLADGQTTRTVGLNQSDGRQAMALYKTDCITLHSGIQTLADFATEVAPPQSATAVLMLVVGAQDDGSNLECAASSDLIPGHVVRTQKTLVVHYKPKFNNYVNYLEVNEGESCQLTVTVRANPFVDNLVFNRVKETTSYSQSSNLQAQDPVTSSLNHLIQEEQENNGLLFESVPGNWQWSLSKETISLNVHNATTADSGLYVARVSNTLGDSLFLTRLRVKTLSTINSIKFFSSSQRMSSVAVIGPKPSKMPLVREGDSYFWIECLVTANPSLTVKWSKQHLYYHLVHSPLSNKTQRSSVHYWQADSNKPFFFDWSRSNVSQQTVQSSSHVDSSSSSQSILSQLLITNVTLEDAGIYTCITPNDTRRIQIPVQHRPYILSGGHFFKIAADHQTSSVKIVCSALANPMANFNWTVNGSHTLHSVNGTYMGKYKIISHFGIGTHHSLGYLEEEKYQFTSEMIIYNISQVDFGTYECIAYNELGIDRSNFELVHKRFPDNPTNLQAINVTHNSAFILWEPGFDYGHAQQYQLQLWHLDDGLARQLTENELHFLPARTYNNLTVPQIMIVNLESDTNYKFTVFAFNCLGRSNNSAFLTVHTLPLSNYLLKPVYASADEQRQNGLMGTRIIGEDFLEITVILCLILLLLLSSVTSLLIYCRRRHRNVNTTNNNVSNNNNDDNNNQTHNVANVCATNPNKLCVLSTSCTAEIMTPTSVVSSVMNNTSQGMAGLCGSTDLATNTNSLSTTSSYIVKDDFTSSFSPSYCSTMDMSYPSETQCKYLPLEKSKAYTDFVAIPSISSGTGGGGDNLVPYELTNLCVASSSSSSRSKNKENCLKNSQDNNNYQLLLSHQQITNVHLLPPSIESEPLSPELSPLPDEYLRFTPLQQYEPANMSKDLCGVPMSSYDLRSQYSSESGSTINISSPVNFNESHQFALLTTTSHKAKPSDPIILNSTHDGINLYEINKNIALSDSSCQSVLDCVQSSTCLESKAIKRVNLVKSANSSISVPLTTLNEEDEV